MRSEQLFITMPVSGQPPQFPAATLAPIDQPPQFPAATSSIPSVTIQGVSTSDGTSSEPPSVSVPNIQSPFNMCANFSAANFYMDSAFGVGTPGGRIPSNLNTPNVSFVYDYISPNDELITSIQPVTTQTTSNINTVTESQHTQPVNPDCGNADHPNTDDDDDLYGEFVRGL